jgi:GNAT superfamily N-acetyltransferase
MGHDVPQVRKVRWAEAADAGDLVRLRAQMLADMGRSVDDDTDPWRASAEGWFADRLGRAREFAAFVVDDPDDGVVACSAGICDFHAPGPGNFTGVRGHVFNMSTFPAHRGRGYALACLAALLEWFRDETEARVINLNATSEGRPCTAPWASPSPASLPSNSYSPSRALATAGGAPEEEEGRFCY